MTDKNEQTTLVILGVHSHDEGYPNVKYRIRDLISDQSMNTTEVCYAFADNFSKKTSLSMRIFVRPVLFAVSHLKCLFYLLKHRGIDTLYIPYPGVFVAALISMIPQCWRPRRTVLDAFISPYDTLVNDRNILRQRNPISLLLNKTERLAYSTADHVIVDTDQNVKFMSDTFHLDPCKFIAIPLTTNETDFFPRHTSRGKTFNVLFIGTLIPLHGIEVILEAARLLRDNAHIKFEIIGDGQLSNLIEQFLRNNPDTIIWTRNWHSSQALNNKISKASVCLGIFGKTEKASRVCPLKIYAYTLCGKPVITGESMWTQAMKDSSNNFPFITIQRTNSAAELADQIQILSSTPEMLASMADRSVLFYQEQLSNRRALKTLQAILRSGSDVSYPTTSNS